MIQPLDWPALVAETIRRRKEEGLTQAQHAALAGVGRTTLIAFDQGDTTLSLGRALAILRVVGLVAEGGDSPRTPSWPPAGSGGRHWWPGCRRTTRRATRSAITASIPK
ncbi:helix-turn-helix domain-containing protein [Azospirillum thermophilum]|nr:helix-turn-helix domain-containing protein [Azospirillum thermophilum]